MQLKQINLTVIVFVQTLESEIELFLVFPQIVGKLYKVELLVFIRVAGRNDFLVRERRA